MTTHIVSSHKMNELLTACFHFVPEEESHVIATAGEDTMINLLRLNGKMTYYH